MLELAKTMPLRNMPLLGKIVLKRILMIPRYKTISSGNFFEDIIL